MNIRIKQLPPLIANQIAAGEVIERPSSVVKELLENSQDAGARNISIELGFAGLNQIKISDDGQGICQDDLPLAVAAHATSKISCLDDLYSIQSMGFRGEALASISSVAKLIITSRTNSQQHAAKLEMQEDKFVISPCARSIGTTVEVLDLFYNAPVRKNFLRGQRIELQYVEDTIKRFALASPNIAISVKHNAKEILNIPASTCSHSRLLRVKKIFGSKFVNSAIQVDFTRQDMQLSGLLGSPNYQRSQRDKQWIYLNNRMLRDKLLQHAVMQIYQEHLIPGRYPACLLYLDIPTDFVDVNVHPTKHEVRFKNPRDVHDFLISSLSSCIEKPEKSQINIQSYAFKPEINEFKLQVADEIQILNSEFAILYQESEPYLVNFRSVYRSYCENILNSATYPLSSRPLLVPVKYNIKHDMYEYFNNLRSLLFEFGITFDFLDTDKLIIRTIPQSLPQLDFELLFAKIDFKKIKSKLELTNLIIDCQMFDVTTSSKDELNMLISYIKKRSLLAKYARHLSKSVCQDLFEDVKKNT